MPSFRRRASLIDADGVDQSPGDAERPADVVEARVLAEEAEAEAAEAEAIAAAAGARARALKLRRAADEAQAQTPKVDPPAESGPADVIATEVSEAEATAVDTAEPASSDVETETDAESADTFDAAVDVDDVSTDGAARRKPSRARLRRLRLRRPKWRTIAFALSGLCTVVLLAASGYMVWQHREAVHDQQQTAEYEAAARQGIVNLMSLNFAKAPEDVQRILDNSTGQFREDFEAQAEDFVRVAQAAKVVTEVTVNAAAVDSMTDDTAVVLVAATSRVSNSSGARDEPRSFRLSVGVQREGDQIKLSRVEFVP